MEVVKSLLVGVHKLEGFRIENINLVQALFDYFRKVLSFLFRASMLLDLFFQNCSLFLKRFLRRLPLPDLLFEECCLLLELFLCQLAFFNLLFQLSALLAEARCIAIQFASAKADYAETHEPDDGMMYVCAAQFFAHHVIDRFHGSRYAQTTAQITLVISLGLVALKTRFVDEERLHIAIIRFAVNRIDFAGFRYATFKCK